jgi:hypothetical protein
MSACMGVMRRVTDSALLRKPDCRPARQTQDEKGSLIAHANVVKRQTRDSMDRYCQRSYLRYSPGGAFMRSRFWSSRLQLPSPCTHPVVTGFAVWMRFRSMAAAGVVGAPFPGPGETLFNTFQAQVQSLEGIYDSNTSDTFASTLCADQSPGMYSGTDFWASIMTKLASLYGGQKFISRFWRHLSSLPAATSVRSAITNWLNDADCASCVNLSSVFYQRWGFPSRTGPRQTRVLRRARSHSRLDTVEPAAT